MQPNPYEPPNFVIRQSDTGYLIARPQSIETEMVDAFVRHGFTFESDVMVDSHTAIHVFTRNGVFLLPYIERFFVFRLSSEVAPSMPLLSSIHAASRAHTNRLHSFSRWARIRIPFTATVVLHESPMSRSTADTIRKKKLPAQSGGPHGIFAVDLSDGLVNYCRRCGFVAAFPIRRANDIFCSVFGVPRSHRTW